jgi:S-adenosylmethionine synthetase
MASPPASAAAIQENPAVSWNRITIRLTAGEVEKINDVVIATQQANRWSKVTTTDVLRVALRRIKSQEAIDAREIKVLRARDGRFSRGGKV